MTHHPIEFATGVKPTLRTIKDVVARYYDIETTDLTGPSRKKVFAHPRQMAMTLCYQITGKSFADVGGAFGGRDHTTVMHAISATSVRMDVGLKRDVEKMTAMIEGAALAEIGGMFRSRRGGPEFRSRRAAQ